MPPGLVELGNWTFMLLETGEQHGTMGHPPESGVAFSDPIESRRKIAGVARELNVLEQTIDTWRRLPVEVP